MEFCVRDSTQQLVAFGGTVWPAAWPSLFEYGYRNSTDKLTCLTEKARAAISRAEGRA